MLTIHFHPECDIPRFIEGAEEYTKIWTEDGERVTEAIERISGFKFRADLYNSIVYGKDRSESYPLTLNCKYPPEQKKSTLIHELTHKVLPRNDVMKASELENHKVLNLILYDIWTDLYGKEFADNAVMGEHLFQPLYKEAWEFALALTKEERQQEFQKFLDSVK
jgi:hypothetical protein